ncbi:NAD-dependent epimerase/dehydratase family protein [Patescibacteria group bacterium]|nr:NAD-dependent epimerase/dehydratase family protein [Patescibacteria group bacterium]MBU1868070.1 NAD-dependent epimerase/dehydratase family protein [Patescibacteria group bacterium]
MNLLITGGSGFIGRNLIQYLINKYPDYKIVNLDQESWDYNKVQYTLIRGDIRNQELVSKTIIEHQIQALINLAHDTSESGIKQVESNICGQYILLDTARENQLERFIYISSNKVYAGNPDNISPKAVLETNPIQAHDFESAHKISADSLALAFYHTHQLPVIILRPAETLGPWLKPKHLISLLITSALQNNPLPIYQEGKKAQDWLYIDDLCTAIDQIIHLKTINGEIFNLGWGAQHSILDIAKLILNNLDRPESLIRFVAEEKQVFSSPPLDSAKAKSVLKWEPKTTFTESLQKTIQWFQNNPGWWQ